MDNKENNLSKNVSSGAEKVENISTRAQAKADGMTEKKPAKPAAQKTSAKKPAAKSEKTAKKVKKEKAQAKKRVDAALAKEQRKAKKAEKKAEIKAKKAEKKAILKAKKAEKRLEMKAKKQERTALQKEKRAERKAERLARKELLKSESKAQRLERIEKERAAKLALKKQKREQAHALRLQRKEARLKKREQRLQERQHRRENRRPAGIGGWIAAVVSLGVVALAMTAVVTFGAINMSDLNAAQATSVRGTLYELVGIMDNVDADLNKVRVSASPAQQSRLLTDLLVQTRLAESSLERFPIDFRADENVTSFINLTAENSQRMLSKLQNGGTLSSADIRRMESLYKTNHEVRSALNSLAAELSDKDLMAFMGDKKGNKITESFQNLENLTLEENNTGAEGPFAGELPRTQKGGEQQEVIPSNRAEELCGEYFKDYEITKIDYAGETVSGIETYNFFLHDAQGRQLFAQIAKNGGELASFDFYEDCKDKNFDLERTKTIAEDYLSGLGYENMTAVWVNESGTEAMFNFVYEANGIVYYPDMVKVKVCETKGKVIGIDATAFLKNHRVRKEANVKLSLSEAEKKLNTSLNVEAARLTVIPVEGREIAAYEFVCGFEDQTYFIYVDAVTGEEARILSVSDSAQGRTLS